MINYLPLFRFQKYIVYFSAALCCAGVIYLLAANWFYFPKYIQLAIPQIILLACCILAIKFGPNTTVGASFMASAGLMIGLCFAVYGQIYQTGADSYEFFLLWSILLIPWFYFKNNGIYSIFCITSFLTLAFVDIQTSFLYFFEFESYMFFLLVILLIIAQYRFLKSRILILIAISFFAIIYSIQLLGMGKLWWLFSFVLPCLVGVFYYFRRYNVGLGFSIFTLFLTSSIYFISKCINEKNTMMIFLVIHLVILFWGIGLTFFLRKVLPNNKILINIPVAVGSWLSAWFLVFFFVDLYVKYFSDSIVLILLGFFLSLFSFLGLKKTYSQYKLPLKTFFIRQILYSFLLAGQLCIFYGLLSINKTFFQNDMVFLSIQLGFLFASCYFIKNKFFITLQGIGFVILLNYFFINLSFFLSIVLLGIWLIFPLKILNDNWRQITFTMLFGNILLGVLFLEIHLKAPFVFGNNEMFLSMNDIFYKYLILGLFFFALYKFRSLIPQKIQIIFSILAIVLVLLEQFNILFLLIALMIIVQKKDYFLEILLASTFALILWRFYYSLHLGFVTKGLVIISSGLVLALVAWLMLMFLPKTMKEELL